MRAGNAARGSTAFDYLNSSPRSSATASTSDEAAADILKTVREVERLRGRAS